MLHIQNYIGTEDVKKIILWSWYVLYKLENFLKQEDAERLYNYISGLQYKDYCCDISHKQILQNVSDSLDRWGENPLQEWYDMVSWEDFFLHKIASIKNKKKVVFIKKKSINVHKYTQWDYHRKHIDNAAKKSIKELDEIWWGKFLWFHLSLTHWWKSGDGWELVFYTDSWEEIVYPPEFNTLWIYSAKDLLHEVIPITEWSWLTRYTLLNMYYWKTH